VTEPAAPPPTGPAAPAQTAPPPGVTTRLARLLGSLVVPILAVVSGLFIGALVIVFSDREIVGLLGRDPLAGLGAAVDSVSRSYGALLTGSIGDPGRIADALGSGDPKAFERAFRPISESLAVRRLLPSIFFTTPEAEELAETFRAVGELAAAVPCFDLDFTPERVAWEYSLASLRL